MGIGYENDSAGRDLPAVLQLKAAAAGFRNLDARFGIDEAAHHHMVVSQVHSLIAQMQTWPRGYAGDYETVEMILSGRCVSQKGTLANPEKPDSRPDE